MIYDCFPFFNELDLLEVRLNYLNDKVDKFVLVEMDKTFSNCEKPFYFENNKKRYEQFLDKIIHIKITDYPKTEDGKYNPWLLENYQRDCIMRGLEDAKPDDIIISCDLDEIPSISAIESYNGSGILSFKQRMTYYYLNCLCVECPTWEKPKICTYNDLINSDFGNFIHIANAYTKKGLPTYIRFCMTFSIENGGWHFSTLGGAEKIAYKIKSFAHQEWNKEEFVNIKNIEQHIKEGSDIFARELHFKPIPLDNTFPEYILKNREKYKHLIIDCDQNTKNLL